MSKPSQAVFLSYASQDVDAARHICDALRAAGIEVWFDQSELRSGDAWDAAIRRQVRECALFIALVSANTNARSEGYFRREWNLAVHRMLDMADDQPFLLPVLIDDTPEPAARVPDRFRERQWSRLPGGQAAAGFVERVTLLLAGEPALPAARHVPHQPPETSAETSAGTERGDEGFWVAVLPFKCLGAGADLESLAEGLSEGIIAGLSRFSWLKVLARGSTSRLGSDAVEAGIAGKSLDARYVMEGSLRQAGNQLRLSVLLVDTVSGAHLWAERYDREFSSDAAFDLLDDLVARIVATCGDRFGVLARSISDTVRNRDLRQIGPYEALMRGFGYHHRLTPDEHAQAREALERAVEGAQANADCWAMLSWVYSHEHAHGFNPRPDSLDRALAAARRAVDLAPSNHLAQQALAVVLFFRKETMACLSAAERAMALNPLDTSNEAMFLMNFTGQWERGGALIRAAMDLNPHHPRWYGVVLGINAYRERNYRAAVGEVVKANAPEVFWTHLILAAAYGQLGELTGARSAARELLQQKPDFAQSGAALLSQWMEPSMVADLADGLRKAGLVSIGIQH